MRAFCWIVGIAMMASFVACGGAGSPATTPTAAPAAKDPVTAPRGSVGGKTMDGMTVEGFDDFYFEIEQHDKIVMCQVTFRKLPPTADIAESVVRSAMQSAIKKHPNQEILGMAFDLNEDALPDRQYGGAVTYKPSDKQILTMRERDGLKTTEQDQGEYLVQVEENKTATGIKPARRWLTVAIVFPKSPSENEVKIAAVREIENLKARQLDAKVFIHTGERANKITWRQTPAPNGKFMLVEYKNASGVIAPNWNWGDLVGPSEIKPEKPETTPIADPNPASTARTWTSADGKFTTEAEFAGSMAGKVKLRKADGTTVTLEADKLSEADREWIKKRAAGK